MDILGREPEDEPRPQTMGRERRSAACEHGTKGCFVALLDLSLVRWLVDDVEVFAELVPVGGDAMLRVRQRDLPQQTASCATPSTVSFSFGDACGSGHRFWGSRGGCCTWRCGGGRDR
jgi:hypothetical protein